MIISAAAVSGSTYARHTSADCSQCNHRVFVPSVDIAGRRYSFRASRAASRSPTTSARGRARQLYVFPIFRRRQNERAPPRINVKSIARTETEERGKRDGGNRRREGVMADFPNRHLERVSFHVRFTLSVDSCLRIARKSLCDPPFDKDPECRERCLSYVMLPPSPPNPVCISLLPFERTSNRKRAPFTARFNIWLLITPLSLLWIRIRRDIPLPPPPRSAIITSTAPAVIVSARPIFFIITAI